MFQEQEPAAGFEHAVQFAHRVDRLVNAAQGKRADDAIELAIVKGEPLAIENALVDRDARLPYPPLGQAVHADVRTNRR
jgi:hypothetical protein